MSSEPARFSLRVLGGCSLTGAGGSVTGPVAQRRRLAVLVAIAAAGRDGMFRDRLLALLWAESAADSARHRLSDTVSVLRAALGAETLSATGDRIALDTSIVDCDAVRFDAAVRRGDADAAVAAYGGPFLDGFHVPDAPEFERWTDAERERRAREYARALETLADRCERAGDRPGAVRWWRRLAAHDPYDARVTTQLMRALEAAGDRAGAIRQAGVHATLLREEIGAAADPGVLALAERLRHEPIPAAIPAPPVPAPPQPADERIEEAREPTVAPHVPPAPAAAPAPRSRSAARLGLALTLGLAVVAAALGAWRMREARDPGDPGLVAVVPFRVAGAPTLGYLREGMLDLLATKLTGDGALRALAPATVLAAWHRELSDDRQDLQRADVLALGRQLGAGRVLEGAVVTTTPGRLTLSVVLLASSDGAERGRAEVSGPADSLPALVDRLAAQILVTDVPVRGQPLAATATASLPALRHYLGAQALVRRGRFLAATARFDSALALDSTFALAAIGAMEVSIFHGFQTPPPRLSRLAWASRERLSACDQSFLVALVGGRRHPEPTTLPERLLDWQQAVGCAPDRASAWSRLGDVYWHYGAVVGVDSFAQRATSAFERALALDSTYAPAYVHLIDIAALRRDAPAARRAVHGFEADGAAQGIDGYRWVAAVGAGDSAAVAALRARMPAMTDRDLDRIVLWTTQSSWAAPDAERASELAWARVAAAPSSGPAIAVSWRRAELLFALGRPAAARRALAATPPDSLMDRRITVFMALTSGADTAAADSAARSLAAFADAPAACDSGCRTAQLLSGCYAELWRVSRGELRGAAERIDRLQAGSPPAIVSAAVPAARRCALLLETQVAVARRAPDAPALLDQLDGAMRLHRQEFIDLIASLFLAREFQARGDPVRALAAVRRREWNVVFAAAPQLREEARLAELTGDAAGALRAYRAYLALHHAPEPALRADVDRARSALGRLAATAR